MVQAGQWGPVVTSDLESVWVLMRQIRRPISGGGGAGVAGPTFTTGTMSATALHHYARLNWTTHEASLAMPQGSVFGSPSAVEL